MSELKAVKVGFVLVDIVAQGQSFVRALRCFAVSIFPPNVGTLSCIVLERDKGLRRDCSSAET